MSLRNGSFSRVATMPVNSDQQDRGSAGAEHHAPEPLAWRQIAAGERDHHRVVAGQQNVDAHDLQRGQPERRPRHFGCNHLHGSIPQVRPARAVTN